MIRETVILLLAVYATVSIATQVYECETGDDYKDSDAVQITECDAPPCILTRGSRVIVTIQLNTTEEIRRLRTTVNAKVFGVSVPFIGVDGSNACDRIYNADGSKAGCPLAKGKEYTYKNSFPVLSIYPKIDTVVHWALTEGRNDLTCFEVPATIV